MTSVPPTISPPARLGFRELAAEPFRLFFPAAVAAGLAGVTLWPLHLWGLMEWYPGPAHARLLAHGFFGGFITGFLGTALPRMLSAPRWTRVEAGVLLGLYLGMVTALAAGRTRLGDVLLLCWLAGLAAVAGARLARRRDLPPPGFALVPLAFLCAMTGAVLSLLDNRFEEGSFWVALRPLLHYQGFILLPILGVGGFILPRFLGLPSKHDYPESLAPPPGWSRRVWASVGVGVLLLVSFVLEARGWARWGHGLRLAVCAGWLWHEIPVHRARGRGNVLGLALKLALALMLTGILTVALFPGYRVALLHTTLIGGFGLITLAVATRVLFGHSGQRARLEKRNRWFVVVMGLILLAMATRVSADFWPKILRSHYTYGALCWAAGLLLWSWFTLPCVLRPDPEQ